MRLDEAALRRPEFTDGVPVVLCDGQEWTFPKPVLEGIIPTKGADGTTRLKRGYDWGPEYEDLVDRYVEALAAGEEFIALADLTFFLLSRNYAFKFEDLRYVFRKAHGEAPDEVRAANDAMLQAISDVALGRDAKKPTPSGSNAPSS